MKRVVNIGILGEFNPEKIAHPATHSSISHAAKLLSIEPKITWLSTPSLLTEKGLNRLAKFDCLWASAGSPYQSMDGMIKGIQKARELNKSFLGT